MDLIILGSITLIMLLVSLVWSVAVSIKQGLKEAKEDQEKIKRLEDEIESKKQEYINKIARGFKDFDIKYFTIKFEDEKEPRLINVQDQCDSSSR